MIRGIEGHLFIDGGFGVKRVFFVLLLLTVLNSFAHADNSVLINLALPQPLQSTAFPALYDEADFDQPNFAIYQKDTRLADLFSKTDGSELCFPSALAQGLIALYNYHSPRFDKLLLPGLSADEKSIDPSVLVRSLAKSCKTAMNTGTTALNQISCVLQELKQSGYGTADVTMINPYSIANANGLPIQHRQVNITDLRYYVSHNYTVIMTVGWFGFDKTHATWTRTGGHAVSVVGYADNKEWQDEQLVLKVVNPNLKYVNDGIALLGDTVTMLKTNRKPGITYPSVSDYTIVGNGFNVNFVESIIAYLPQ